MQLRDAIKKRKTVTRYLEKKPDWRKIVQAMDASRYAPNAGDQTALKFILVSSEEKIKYICEATQQDFVGKAKYIVVIASDDEKLTRNYGDRGKRYSSLQAGAAIQNFLLLLTEKKLVTKWVKYFSDDLVKKILEIPDKITIEGIFPIGLETKIKSKEEKRLDLENMVFFDKWGQKTMTPQTRVKLDSV